MPNKRSRSLASVGQATVEYIFILAFAVAFTLKATNLFSDFFNTSMGSVGHVLSTNLIVGECPRECFYGGYKNGSK
jgi:hypothetical protein